MEKFINSLIQYEENIFYLKLLLNNIKKGHIININRELFQQKLKDDLFFIYKTTEILFEHLISNKKLITKDEQLHSIQELKNLLLVEIEALIRNKIIKENDFKEILLSTKKDIIKIDNILEKINKELSKEDLTTNEELNILLMNNLTDEVE